jgi:hypothetical protein
VQQVTVVAEQVVDLASGSGVTGQCSQQVVRRGLPPTVLALGEERPGDRPFVVSRGGKVCAVTQQGVAERLVEQPVEARPGHGCGLTVVTPRFHEEICRGRTGESGQDTGANLGPVDGMDGGLP